MRRCCAVLLAYLTTWSIFIATAAADESVGRSQSARQLLTRAFQVSQDADSTSSCTESLKLCRDAKKLTKDKAEITYIRTLAAWIFNKRGELFATQSEEDSGLSEQQSLKLAKQALSDFNSSLKLDSDGDEAWKVWHNRGVSRAAFGRFEEAIQDFDVAIKLNPRFQNAWFNRAELHYQSGNYAQAEADYSRAIQLDPQDAIAVTGRGHTRYHLEKYEEALEDYNLSIRLQPEAAKAYADRADLYAHTQQWESAARDYRVALSLDKTLARAYKNVAWLMATCPDDRFRNPPMAIKAATKAVQLAGKDDYRYLEVLSVAQSAVGQTTVARQTLQKAIAIAPADAAEQMKVQLAEYTQPAATQ